MVFIRKLKLSRIMVIVTAVLVSCACVTAMANAEIPASSSLKVNGSVLTGIDVLERDGFRQLDGQRIGLITNQTGINAAGTSTIQLLHDAKNIQLRALFSPEHGLLGKLDIALIENSVDSGTGIEVFSLYGSTRKPEAEMLDGLDTLVFDIQDIGTRFYTYISTMGHAMQAAAEHGVRFVVLDRPNPINGITVSGPVLDDDRESFTAFHRLPIRHGMTTGELARMFKAELELDIELDIIAVEGWQRSEFFDDTGLPWINPSPNMRSLTEAILYPGIGLLETTNLSVGRGTDTPFELFGAPWLDGKLLAAELNRLDLPGVLFSPIQFTPDSSKFKDELCQGVLIRIIDRGRFEPLRAGLEIALQLRRLYPQVWDIDSYDRLLANAAVLAAIRNGDAYPDILAMYTPSLEKFKQRRLPYLIYP